MKIWFNYDKLGLSQIVCENIVKNARLQNFPSHFRRNFHLEFNFFINPTVQGFHTVPKAKTNQNLSIKTKHVTARADAAVHLQYTVCCTSIIYLHILYIQYSRHSIQIFWYCTVFLPYLFQAFDASKEKFTLIWIKIAVLG